MIDDAVDNRSIAAPDLCGAKEMMPVFLLVQRPAMVYYGIVRVTRFKTCSKRRHNTVSSRRKRAIVLGVLNVGLCFAAAG